MSYSLGRRQAFLDGVRDELRGAWVDAVQLGKVERGEVSDHCEVHQHGERRLAFAAHGMDRNLAAQIVRQPIDALTDPGDLQTRVGAAPPRRAPR